MSKDDKIMPCKPLSWQEQLDRDFAKVAAETEAEEVSFTLSPKKIQKKIRHLNVAASQAIASGDIECAIQHYKEVIFLDKENTIAHTSLGNLYIEQQDYNLARNSFYSALDADDQFVPALIGLGRLLLKQNILPDAQRRFKEALKIDPEDGYALTGLAKAFNKQGMTRAAAAKYKLAIAANPHDFVAQTHLGLMRYEEQNYDEAYQLFKDVLWGDHGNKAAGFLKAQIDIQQGQLFKARNTLVSSIDRSMDKSCLVLYFSITDIEDEGHKYYADKIGQAEYEALQGRIERCRENPRWEAVPEIEDEATNEGLLQTLLKGYEPS